MAEQTAICPKCTRAIPASAPKGLCPACLVAAVFESDADETPHAEMPSPAAPDELVGSYRLLDQLGRGGMGVVFRARDLRLSRIVALKLLLTGKLASEMEVKRFRAEAEAAAHLEHPNIVPIYEVGEDKGWPFFTMKLVEPGSLADRLRSSERIGITQSTDLAGSGKAAPRHPNSVPAIAQLMIKVAKAVHFAHTHGILHRDLKPANILLNETGEPFVTDFGLARRLESDAGITSSGAVLGTPSYLAPEVAGGGSGAATTASDVYSLGAILYELLAGKPPFEAATVPLLLRRIADEDPLPPSRVRTLEQRGRTPAPPRQTTPASRRAAKACDRDLETICLKCLAKDPGGRYTSARALADDLERWQRGEPILARPAGLAEQALKWARRKPAWTLVLLLLLLAPLAVISVLLAGNARVRHAQQVTRLNLYAADMQVAQAALEDANLAPAQRILEAYRPRPGERDLRGFEWRYLWHRARSGQLRVLRAHSQPLLAVSFSPDGNWLASLEAGRTVWFWSTTTWRAERVLDWSGANYNQFCWASFAPDGAMVAVTQEDGYVPLLDSQTLQAHWCLWTGLPADSSKPRVLWSPIGTKMAFLGTNIQGGRFTAVLDWPAFMAAPGPPSSGAIEIVSDTTLPLKPVGYPQAPMLRLAAVDALHSFTADGHLLARRDGLLVDFDVEHGGRETVLTSAHHFDYCERSPDGKFRAGYNSELKYRHSVLIDQFVPGDIYYWETIGHEGEIRCLAISPDSKKILSGSADHTARVWDANTRQTIAVLRGHTDEVTAVAWSPDGKLIATGSKDRTVMLWDGLNTNALEQAAEPLTSMFPPWTLSEDGTRLAAATRLAGTTPGRLAVCQLAGGHTNELPASRALWPLCFSASARELLTINLASPSQAEMRWWDLTAQTNFLAAALPLEPPAERADSVWALSPSGRWLARGDGAGGITTWRALGVAPTDSDPEANLRTKPSALRFENVASPIAANGQAVTTLAFAKVTDELALLRRDRAGVGVVTLWRPGGLAQTNVEASTGVNALAWSPDGSMLALGCEDHSVQLWDVANRQLSQALTGHKRGVAAVAFTADGRTLASGDGRTIKLWQTATGRETLTLYRDIKTSDPLLWLAFTPDDARLLAGDQVGRIQVFSAPRAPETQ